MNERDSRGARRLHPAHRLREPVSVRAAAPAGRPARRILPQAAPHRRLRRVGERAAYVPSARSPATLPQRGHARPSCPRSRSPPPSASRSRLPALHSHARGHDHRRRSNSAGAGLGELALVEPGFRSSRAPLGRGARSACSPPGSGGRGDRASSGCGSSPSSIRRCRSSARANITGEGEARASRCRPASPPACRSCAFRALRLDAHARDRRGRCA
jgi:hypothetical protein